MDIISQFEQAFPSRALLFVVQVYETISDESRDIVEAALDWTDLKIYFDLMCQVGITAFS